MSEFSVTAIRIRIFLSVVVALLLTTMPLPELVSPYRPLFVPLVILFWSIFFPLRFTLFMALLAGLALEASQTLVFGQTALGLIVISVFALSNHRRIQLAALPQQLLTVAALL
ncbi:MAG: rod shape-determining protein MreD, partial [Gammaproteobacteria bacterium]|nr:rod shape-determining protein MreD [Gammaproteobacteria bacterium]